MRLFLALLLAACLWCSALSAADEEYKVYTEHPRLLLPKQRLRLLRRERERDSMRWQQFHTLMRGKARMGEPAFAHALLYQTANEEAAGRAAIEAALKPAASLREVALVVDWCDPLLSEGERSALRARLAPDRRAPKNFNGARDRAFAAIVTEDAASLRGLVVDWWRGQAAPALLAGDRTISHEEFYAFMEFLHAVRDNLQIDLREDIRPLFRELPLWRMLGYYPASFPAGENEYRIPYFDGVSEPDLRTAALSRAGEFALVAYENNAEQMQFLQGWLMQDRFMLRGAFGAPYEFLWANPYQPGLPFEKMPLQFHHPASGTLLVRASWDEDSAWAAVWGGRAQLFREGRLSALPVKQPLALGETALFAGTMFSVTQSGAANWFLTGLKPRAVYDVEVDDEDMTEARTDRGGTLPLGFSRTDGQVVRVRPAGVIQLEPRR